MPQQPKPLKDTTIGLMISTALFFDVLQWAMAFIFMDWLVSIFAYMTFWLWFRLNGIKFTSPKRLATAGTSALLEILPFVAALPALTGGVAIIALDTKIKKLMPGKGSETVEKEKAA